jgi:hypothetical protein
MKQLLPVAFTLALSTTTLAEMPKEVYNTIDTLLQTSSRMKTKKQISSLADKLGDKDGKATDKEMVYALDFLVSEDSQKYISNKLFGETKTIDELSIKEQLKIKLKYPQIVYITKLRKRYLNR